MLSKLIPIGPLFVLIQSMSMFILYFAIFLFFGSILLLIHDVWKSHHKILFHKIETLRANNLNNLFIFLPAQLFYKYAFLLGLLSLWVGFLLNLSFPIIIFTSMVIVFSPLMLLTILKYRQHNRFSKQLIPALLYISNSLKNGTSLVKSLELTRDHFSAPISLELKQILLSHQLGTRLEAAFLNCYYKYRIRELFLAHTLISVFSVTHRSLSFPLYSLCLKLSETSHVKSKINAMTIQAKLQGLLSLLIAPLVLASYSYLNPEFINNCFLNPSLKRYLLFGLSLNCLGYLLIGILIRRVKDYL